MTKSNKYIPWLLILLLSMRAKAEISLSALFSDNMILQQKSIVKIWGYGNVSEKVGINASWNNETYFSTTDTDGVWEYNLATPLYGGPYTIKLTGDSTLTLKNILIGDVWLCSGQSNMEMPIGGWGKVLNYEMEIANANYDQIRYFNVNHYTSNQPLQDVKYFKQWQVCSPKTAEEFSAVAYFFAREVYNKTKIPIGIINASYQGTAIQAWMGRDAFIANAKMKRITDSIFTDYKTWEQMKNAYDSAKTSNSPPFRPQDTPTVLYNAMIYPLKKCSIKGFLWYQGENNVGGARLYEEYFKAMINNWRQTFNHQNLPFYFVQLANYKQKTTDIDRSYWAELREAQAKALSLPFTGMAIAIDIGEADNVHPKNKQEVGRRLALVALSKSYKRNISYSGPIFKKVKRKNGSVILFFKHAKRLRTNDGASPKGFIIAGNDKKFVHASARISGNRVVISSRKISKPVSVRYGWGDNPDCNLYNKYDLPAAPFKTDSWDY